MSGMAAAAKANPAKVPLAECALARAIGVIGDGWTLLILRESVYGVVRFGEMQADLGIPRAVLSDRLTKLVAAGLFSRVAYREPGQRSRDAYQLTAKGHALMPALVALREWATAHVEGPPSPLHLRHVGCGAEVHTRLACEAGHLIEDPTELATSVEHDSQED